MSEFYMTYERNRPNELVPWIEVNNVPLLTNAATRWSNNTDRFLNMWEYDTKQVIDAGGYNVQSRFVDDKGNLDEDVTAGDISTQLDNDAPFYPWSVEEYHEWLQDHKDEFEWATVMDYACEGRFDDMWSVQDRMDATIDTTIQHFNHNPDYKVLPVLQGYSVEDYIESYERLRDHGIPTDYVGIGTVCRISSQNEIVNVEEEIRERTNIDTIHGFGVKVSAYKLGAGFDTADSAAWLSNPMNKKVFNIDHNSGEISTYTEEMYESDRRSDSSLRRTVHSFQTYYAYVTWLMEGEPAVDVEDIIERQNLSMDEYIDLIRDS